MASPAAEGAFPPHAAFTLLNQSREVFVIAGGDGVLRYVSPSASNLFGFKNVDVLGKPATYFIHPDDHAALGALCGDAVAHVASREATRLRHRTTAAGAYVPMDCRACFDGEFLFLTMLDASEATRVEDSLRESLSTSHDLRTPVHSIQTCVALLLSEPAVAADASAVALLRGVGSACEVLTLNIGNTLRLSRLDAPQRVQSADFELRTVLRHAVALLCGERVRWSHRGGEADADAALAQLPATARGDAGALALAAQNCLMTAARMLAWHDPEAPLRVDASTVALASAPRDSGPDAPTLELRLGVAAPGFVLTHEECAALVDPFGLTPPDKGSVMGLPLFLARRAARALGGDLELSCSAPGVGAPGIELLLRVPLCAARGGGGTAALLSVDTTPPPPSENAATTPAPSEAGPPSPMPERLSELEVSRRMFSFLVENSDDLFLIATLEPTGDDADATSASMLATSVDITYASPNVARVLGVMPQDLAGRDACMALFVAADAGVAADALATAAGEARRAPGWLSHVQFSARVQGGAGRPPLWLDVAGVTDGHEVYCVLRDAAPRRASQAALRRFSVATAAALRAPCASILLGAELLEARPAIREATPPSVGIEDYGDASSPDHDARFLIRAIRAACALLLGVVGNVVSARALEAGELALQASPFSVADVIDTVLQAVQLAGGGAGATAASRFVWEREPADALPDVVVGDRQRIQEVLLNLCTNAQKWGQGRPVRVSCHLNWRSCLVLTVADAGAGLSAEAAQARWLAGARCAAEAGGGVGLGLYVSTALARLMGGSLTVATSPGLGATFTLTVPVRVPQPREAAELGDAAAAAAAAAEASGRTVATDDASSAGAAPPPSKPAGRVRYRALVADDHALNLQVVTRLLTTQGFDVTAVPDGQVALEVLSASLEHESAAGFDVAVLDVQMPRRDGPGCCAAFRALERARRPGLPALPVLALSAAVADEALGTCTQAGMNAFIAKPLRAEAIAMVRACAAEYAEARAAEEAQRRAAGTPPPEKRY